MTTEFSFSRAREEDSVFLFLAEQILHFMHTTISRPHAEKSAPKKRDPRTFLLNILIVALVLLVAFLSYSFLTRHLIAPPVESNRSGAGPGEIIQLDVLNGCGAQRAATRFTSYLRARGFDVVEMHNYKTFDVGESLVIDRRGNRTNAEKVAYALGINKRNVVQQLNQDYYVDVSVVIGKDYSSLKPPH